MGKRETKNLQSEIEKSRVELNDLQKKIKGIIEKGKDREKLAREAETKLKEAKPPTTT